MKVSVYTSEGGRLDVADLPDEDALTMREDFADGDSPTLQLMMDGATVLVSRAHVVRIDFETGDDS